MIRGGRSFLGESPCFWLSRPSITKIEQRRAAKRPSAALCITGSGSPAGDHISFLESMSFRYFSGDTPHSSLNL